MTEEPLSVGDAVEGRPGPRRARLGLLTLLSLLAVGGVALAWSQPANNDLRVAATEQEFIDALDAMKAEWYCAYDEYAIDDSVGYMGADCNLGSDGTRLSVEYYQDLEGTLALIAELRERDPAYPAAFASGCTYIGEHVMVTWSRASATDEDVQKVGAALDGWKQPDDQPDCP